MVGMNCLMSNIEWIFNHAQNEKPEEKKSYKTHNGQ